MVVTLVITLWVITVGLSFWAGVRYALAKLMPVVLARMTPKELVELAKKAADERPGQQ